MDVGAFDTSGLLWTVELSTRVLHRPSAGIIQAFGRYYYSTEKSKGVGGRTHKLFFKHKKNKFFIGLLF